MDRECEQMNDNIFEPYEDEDAYIDSMIEHGRSEFEEEWFEYISEYGDNNHFFYNKSTEFYNIF